MSWLVLFILIAGGLCFAGAISTNAGEKSQRPAREAPVVSGVEQGIRAEWKQYSMCTRMMLPRGAPEYVCPVCGEKTLYAETNRWRLGRLDHIRYQVDAMKKHCESNSYSVELDETAYCRNCTPELQGEPDAILSITLPDGEKMARDSLQLNEVRYLERYLLDPGMAVHPRLRELLGQEKKEE